MRYLDPEALPRSMPRNFDTRPPPTDARPRRLPLADRAALDRDLDRYGARKRDDAGETMGVRNGDGPPPRPQDDLDRYGTRRQKEDQRAPIREAEGKDARDRDRRDYDDWRTGRDKFQRGDIREEIRFERAHRPDREGSPKRSASPVMRKESPMRGDRSGSESDMDMDGDD